MASMTRGRVKNAAIAPTPVQALYYEQRATAGLILTEGTWISRQAIGYAYVPGIFTQEQIEGWQLVTNAVHGQGGHIFLQLGHAGSLSHPEFLDGDVPVAPSAVNPNFTAFLPSGPQPTVVPRELTPAEIRAIVRDYRTAAQNAKTAGFDGVELHAQHPSLIAQFLSDTLNQRTDAYGGSTANKARFLFEILDALIEVWGSQRVSLRLNPFLNYSGSTTAPEPTLPTYRYVVEKLNAYHLAFLHLMDRREPDLAEEAYAQRRVFETFRPLYNGLLMANGGLSQDKANALLRSGLADLVSFGVPYIANPDLVERIAHHRPLAQADPATFFVGDDEGYIDYPALNPLPAST
ncbi:alkene reductase [Hymenobacter terricola]|uniref:alkene reductase n=1 Tax=Hymenobacter terricola TaxID=2819236 RepID=UPI0021D47FB8|nr:alkene reductase [Hymenobacter terricola]